MGEVKFVHDEIDGEMRFRTPRWAEFAAWWDSISRGHASDAARNLVAACAIAPDANALSEEFEDGLGFLPAAIADRLLDHIGAPEAGFGQRYPVVPAEDVPAEVRAAAKERTKRKPLFFQLPGGVWALRAPGASAGGAYTDAVTAFNGGRPDASLAEASRLLVLSCVLSPSAELAAAQIQESPHIVYALVDALREAGGAAGKGLRGA